MVINSLSRFPRTQRGFTLIELAIVLVVIGLLIGGVLVGQSLIDSTKLSSQIGQFQQYDIAVTQFRNRYGQLPGDSNLLPSTGAAGNNNGIIDGANYGGASSTWGAPSEAGNFWRHLSASGSISETWGSATHNNVRAGIDAPNAKLGIKGSLIQGMTLQPTGNSFGGMSLTQEQSGNYWVLCFNATTLNAGFFCRDSRYGGALTAVQALALDTKMDDGVPNTGAVLAAGDAGNLPGGDYGVRCLTQDFSAYNTNPVSQNACCPVSSASTLCNLHLKMFSLAGGSQ